MLLDKLESGVVALETDHGPVYVQPSGWERLYLLWTFRNFNSLPLKTLNSRQRRMVERLPRCSARIGLTEFKVIGTVEGAPVPPLSETLAVEAPAIEISDPVVVPAVLRASVSSELREIPKTQSAPSRTSARASSLSHRKYVFPRPALILATAALSAVAVIAAWPWLRLVKIPGAPIVQTAKNQTKSVSAEPDVQTKASETPVESTNIPTTPDVVKSPAELPSADSSISDVTVSKPIVMSATPSTASESEAIENSKFPEAVDKLNSGSAPRMKKPVLASLQEKEVSRMEISGPPLRIIYPEYPPTSVQGKVSLRAVIGVDGRVRDVTILSGNRILSAAAARAVRQWRYNPSYENGAPVETETNVGVLFVADDVISITFPGAHPISQ